MLTGKHLGDAIAVAIQRKIASTGVSKRDIADHFGIKEPSIADWIKKGSIAKEKLPRLWAYFSDVAGLEHWGLSAADFKCFGLVREQELREPDLIEYQSPRGQRIKTLLAAIDPISDAGIDHLTSYALWVANQYPRAKAKLAR